MSKFTPGPWFVKNGEIRAWDAEEKRSIPLCSVYRTEAYCQGFKPETEDQFNAVLIAAAPELLEALEVCAETFRRYAQSHAAKGNTAKEKANLDLEKMCRDVIAKAKGGQ